VWELSEPLEKWDQRCATLSLPLKDYNLLPLSTLSAAAVLFMGSPSHQI
jgi:hypothetical protein